MNRRHFAASVILLVLCIAGGAFGAQTEVKYDKWGFSITLPRPFEKRIQSGSGRVVSEVFVLDGMGFIVTLAGPPSDALSSTAIEQALQAAYRSSSKDDSVRRWEMNSRRGDLFKGISRPIDAGDAILSEMPYIGELLGKKPGFMTLSMSPLSDESSPILSVGVVGPREHEMEIEAEAKGFAHTVRKILLKGGGNADDMQPKQPAKPRIAAAPAKPKVHPALRKGQIELVGVVQSLNPRDYSLIILVDEVTEPGHGTAKLDPARPKVVFIRRLPKEVAAGTRVLVVGKDTGVGNPITAGTLEAVSDSLSGKGTGT